MFENLTESLKGVLKSLKGERKISEIKIAEIGRELKRALLNADVALEVANEFVRNIKQKATGLEVKDNATIEEMFIVAVHEELTTLLGDDKKEIDLSSNPSIILMAGLQGSGKTTFSAKLAAYLMVSRKRRVLLVADDIYRPAAKSQLKLLGSQIGVDVYVEDSKDPVNIAQNAVAKAKREGYDLIIVDTAGRLAIDEGMMLEIENIKKAVNPQEILFVVDSMTGQDAVNTAKVFNDRLDFSGIILTKLDGDTRGGVALSIKEKVKKPIKFIGVGEKLGDIEEFNPKGIAGRILGRGDLQALINKIGTVFNPKDINTDISKNFTFNDFIDNIKRIKKMGSIKDILSLIPGLNDISKKIDIEDNAFTKIEAIIQSMTPYEKQNPDIVIRNISRRKRIAKGSGNSMKAVDNFIFQFDKMRKMMKKMSTGKIPIGLGDFPFGKMSKATKRQF